MYYNYTTELRDKFFPFFVNTKICNYVNKIFFIFRTWVYVKMTRNFDQNFDKVQIKFLVHDSIKEIYLY